MSRDNQEDIDRRVKAMSSAIRAGQAAALSPQSAADDDIKALAANLFDSLHCGTELLAPRTVKAFRVSPSFAMKRAKASKTAFLRTVALTGLSSKRLFLGLMTQQEGKK